MTMLPHHYKVSSQGKSTGNLTLSANNLPSLEVAPPAQFGGPGDQWSPEDLLMAAAANCLVLSFRAIARAAKFNWLTIQCDSEGLLDKVDRKTQFTALHHKATLTLPADGNSDKARKLLQQAEDSCLISNSLACPVHLDCEIIISSAI